MGKAMSRNPRPRVLIMGACTGVGRACAEALGRQGAELILSDHDGPALQALSTSLGAVSRFCDIVSETSVDIFAAEIRSNFETLDVLINAAGTGFERTLGMYRVSNALLPALRNNPGRTFIFNVPPGEQPSAADIFPYAGSRQAFLRLCEVLADELRGSSVSVRVACQQRLQIGTVQAAADVEDYGSAGAEGPVQDNAAALATRIASLIFFSDASDRRRTLMSPPRAERKVGRG